MVVLGCVLFVVTLCHRRVYMNGMRKDPELLQVSLDGLTPELLSERQPILLNDILVDPRTSLLDTVFRKQYIKMDASVRCVAGEPLRCRARYTLITQSSGQGVLRLAHETKRGVAVDIAMAGGQALIMPPGWQVQVDAAAPGCDAVGLHDLFTFFWQ